MNKVMKRFFASSMISSVFYAILGLLLIFKSELTIISIAYFVGGALISLGIVGLFRFINKSTTGNGSELDILYGLVTMILGSLVISNPKALVSIIPFVIGICIVVSSSAKLQYAFQLKRNENETWLMTMIVAMLSTVFGVVLIFNPFKGATMLTQIIGTVILIYAILDIISTITIRKNVMTIKSAIEETIKDAEIVEEDEDEEKEKKIETKKSTTKKDKSKDEKDKK